MPAYFDRIACLLARRSAKVSSTVLVLSNSNSISISVSVGLGLIVGGVDGRVDGFGDVETMGEFSLLLDPETLQNS